MDDIPSLEIVVNMMVVDSDYDITLERINLNVLYYYKPSTYKLNGKTILECFGLNPETDDFSFTDILDGTILNILVTNAYEDESTLQQMMSYIIDTITSLTSYDSVVKAEDLVAYDNVIREVLHETLSRNIVGYVDVKKVINYLSEIDMFYLCTPLHFYICDGCTVIETNVKKYRRKR